MIKKCSKDCKHFMEIANTDECGQGICSYPMTYFPVTMHSECKFAPQPYTCKDCTNFTEYECLTVEENDKPCMFFVDVQEDKLYNILHQWKLRGIDIKEKTSDIIKCLEKDFKEL